MMDAVVLRSPKKLEFAQVPIPKLTREEHILVRVEACGICGSDLRYWAGENPWALHTIGRHVDNPPNIIMGHEFAGVVTEVNSSRYEQLIGQRVGVQSYRVCGECALCRSGRHNLCKHTIHLGHGQGWGKMDYYPGAYGDYTLAWADLVYPLPDDVSFAEAAMADIFCVAVHAMSRATLRDDAAVLCIGGGPIGLSIAQVARAKGARQVFVSEISPLARQIASQLDLVVIDPGSQSVREVVRERAGSATVSAVFDTVGSERTIMDALELLEESGTYVSLAVHNASQQFNPAVLASERTVTTSSNALYRDVAEAYELIFSKHVDAGAMISHRLPLSDYQRAFDLLLADPKQAYKVVFTRE